MSSYPKNCEDAVTEYMNRAGRRMYAYFSDLKYDIQSIRNLEPNQKVYFIICPSNTHRAFPNELEELRDSIRKTWGNHIVIEIRREGENNYFVENYDKELTHNWGNYTPQHVIDAFNDFILESEDDI